jgi:hypothetical protein
MSSQPTQAQMYYQAQRKQADGDNLFMEMVKDGSMTKGSLRKLIERRPETWGRYSNWLDSPHLKEA